VLDFGDVGSEAAFVRLFRTVLLKGAFVAAQHAGEPLPRRFRIEVRGGDRPGTYDDVGSASIALFRADGLFYARIDLAVGEIASERARAIVARVRGVALRLREHVESAEGLWPLSAGSFRDVSRDLDLRAAARAARS
jgi:hypothetical protein